MTEVCVQRLSNDVCQRLGGGVPPGVTQRRIISEGTRPFIHSERVRQCANSHIMFGNDLVNVFKSQLMNGISRAGAVIDAR
jgi:hypothetical protein